MSQFFEPGDQGIGVSASASVFPKNIQDSRHLGWTGWISLQFCGSVVSCLFSNQWTAVRQASLSTASSQSLLKLGVRRVGDAIQPSSSSVVPFPIPPSIFPSIREVTGLKSGSGVTVPSSCRTLQSSLYPKEHLVNHSSLS